MDYLHALKDSITTIKDDRMINYPLMGGSQLQAIIVAILYLFLTKKIGPNFMASRKPYNVQLTMQIFNILQIIFNAWLSIDQLIFILNKKSFKFNCAPVDASATPQGLKEANLVYAYFLLKLFDLLDTAFMVLKKDFNRISVLHLYHHGSMIIITQGVAQYSPGGPYSTVVTVNSFVHVVMYSYYLISSNYPGMKGSIWWKKHITHLQILQFFFLMTHFGLHILSNDCNYPKFWSIVGFMQNVVVFILFCNFYIQSYLIKKKDKLNRLKVQ